MFQSEISSMSLLARAFIAPCRLSSSSPDHSATTWALYEISSVENKSETMKNNNFKHDQTYKHFFW